MIAGQKFGRLTFVKDTGERRDGARVGLFICECGRERHARFTLVTTGKTKSCGCFSRDRSTTHGMYGTREYCSWYSMLTRCRNPKNKDFLRYGGRGIAVCERWLSFANFYSDMGRCPPGHDLHRVDNEKGYEPGNCVWLEHSEHMRLTRRTAR